MAAVTARRTRPARRTRSEALARISTRWLGRSVKLLIGLVLILSSVVVGREIHLSKASPPTPEPALTSSGPAASAPSESGLPYRLAPIHSSEKKVFAHYFPPYPISLDNKPPQDDYYTRHYLNPDGENGKYRASGGLLRDRPIGRPPIAGDFRLIDATTEVRQAAAAGIDGFTVDILDWSGPLWQQSLLIAEAATHSGTGFVVLPNLDLNSDADDSAPEFIAGKLAEFFALPGAYRLPDGRFVLSSFLAEDRSVEWWRGLVSELRDEHAIDVALIAVLLDSSEDNLEKYAPISYALSSWGARTPNSILTAPNKASLAHRAGAKWMAPVAVQDARHRDLIYAEAGNTETLRASWARAIEDQADLVQLVTWNDYSESTHFAPSRAHGSSFLDINGYYATHFKTGRAPRITGDELVVTHRIAKHGSEPTVQSGRMEPDLSGSSSQARDTVEVLAMLKAPAELTISVGPTTTTFAAPAGLSSTTVPLKEGVVSATASRARVPIAAVTSPHAVLASLPFYDLQYYAASSRD